MSSKGTVPALSHSDGLDIFRSAAILLVLAGHWTQHGHPSAWAEKWIGWGGVPGVELFFVLSGFLIGGIIVRLIDEGRFQTIEDISRFWGRRWLRTLPLYYFFLLIFLRVDWRGPFDLLHFPSYFFFSQNLLTPTPSFFELSWSLAIEEWFYLIFPLIFLACGCLFEKVRTRIFVSVGLLIAVPFLLRVGLIGQEEDLFSMTRVPVMFRLDSLMYGVIISIVSRYRPPLWKKIEAAFPIWLVLFLGFQVVCILYVNHLLAIDSTRPLIFPVMSITCSLMLPFMASVSLSRWRALQFFFSTTSKLSYSIYLGHIVVIIFANKGLASMGPLGGMILDRWYVLYPIYAALTFALAYCTYQLVEQPMLKLRDRLSWTRANEPVVKPDGMTLL